MSCFLYKSYLVSYILFIITCWKQSQRYYSLGYWLRFALVAEEQDFFRHLESSVLRRDVDDVCCHCVMMDASELDVDKVRVCVVFVKADDDLGLQGDKAGELEPLRVDQSDV